jgi:poly(A) polymerase
MLITFENLFPTQRLTQILRQVSHANRPIFLVGGALRDALLGRSSHDLDLVVGGDVQSIAKTVADALGGALYILDDARGTVRVLYRAPSGKRYTLDFSRMRGLSIEHDLRARDFTINALAINIAQPDRIIDPLKGAQDLRKKRLRACSETAFEDDPIRVLRGVRLAVTLKFQFIPNTIRALKAAASSLERVSAERKRDELFRILEGEEISTALRLMDSLGILAYLLPELSATKGVAQPPPHVFDVWEHTLHTLLYLEQLFALLVADYNEEKSASLLMGLATLRLGRFRRQFIDHYLVQINPNRTLRGLLFLAALYHDSGKPATQTFHDNGKMHFIGHEKTSAHYFTERGRSLALSNDEIEYGVQIVRHHMRIHHLAAAPAPLSRRAIYRFFHDAGKAGVDICLLNLADTLATYHTTITQEVWDRELTICQELLDAWWNHQQDIVNPAPLVRGDDLIQHLGISPGPLIGQLLEAIREAQASGSLSTPEEALALARTLLDQGSLFGKGNNHEH